MGPWYNISFLRYHVNNFKESELHNQLIATLENIGFHHPTPIQQQAIPLALKGSDIFASAQTGTGKTAAFLLPVISQLAIETNKNFKALILVPTRELAEQVSKEAIRFSRKLPQIKTVCIYGGMPYREQNRLLSRPHHILVATPGRLIDHVLRGRISLAHVKYFVLDEADRMLDMGFIGDVERIAEQTSKNRQTLLFSATLSPKIKKISENLQNNPEHIAIAPETKEGKIDQHLYFVDNMEHKIRLLNCLCEDPALKQAIVFTSTKMQAEKLSHTLRDKGYNSASLHGDINQRNRNLTLKGLRLGKIQILVATDVAARGIDVISLTHVINFDVPRQAEDFVHRIGRTGRAGADGIAITFATYNEKSLLASIHKLTGKEMEVRTLAGLEPKPEKKVAKKPLTFKRRNRRTARFY
jgi:superfamily II DNA/RNA helicase